MLNSRKCFKRTTLQTRHSTGNRDEKLKGKVYLVNHVNFEWYQNFENGFSYDSLPQQQQFTKKFSHKMATQISALKFSQK